MQGVFCLHKPDYSDEGQLATHDHNASHVVASLDHHTYLQEYFNSKYNGFGNRCGFLCGTGISLENLESSGCSGSRKKRTQIVQKPDILEIMILGERKNDITNPGRFEHRLEIHGKVYTFLGALLYNGSHYRTLLLIETAYILYDGNFKSQNRNEMDSSQHREFFQGVVCSKSVVSSK